MTNPSLIARWIALGFNWSLLLQSCGTLEYMWPGIQRIQFSNCFDILVIGKFCILQQSRPLTPNMRIRHGKTVNIDKVKFITLLVTIQVLWVCLYYQGWRLKNVYTKCWCRKWFSRNDVQDIIWWNVPTFPGKLFSFHSMKENSQWKKMLYLIMYFGHSILTAQNHFDKHLWLLNTSESPTLSIQSLLTAEIGW